MSFYGGIFNQISNAFETINVKNSGENTNNVFDSGVVSSEIKADGREGELCIDSGNRWIHLQGDSTDNFCKIFHTKPDEKENSSVLETVSIVNSAPQDFIEINLSQDSYLKISGVCYDNLGHVSGINDQYLMFKQVNAAEQLKGFGEEIENFKDSVNGTLNKFDGRLINQEVFVDRVAALEGKIGGIDTNASAISTLQGSVNTALSESGAAVLAVGGINSTLLALDGRIAALEGRIAALESKIQ